MSNVGYVRTRGDLRATVFERLVAGPEFEIDSGPAESGAIRCGFPPSKWKQYAEQRIEFGLISDPY